MPTWAEMIPYLRIENLKNHTLSCGTYLHVYSPYMGVPLPPPFQKVTPDAVSQTACFPTHLHSSFSNMEHCIQKWFIHIKVYFVLSKKEEDNSSRSSRHFVPTDQNELCTHDKNRKHAELWVKINLFNVFVMYALGSVHEKFDV